MMGRQKDMLISQSLIYYKWWVELVVHNMINTGKLLFLFMNPRRAFIKRLSIILFFEQYILTVLLFFLSFNYLSNYSIAFYYPTYMLSFCSFYMNHSQWKVAWESNCMTTSTRRLLREQSLIKRTLCITSLGPTCFVDWYGFMPMADNLFCCSKFSILHYRSRKKIQSCTNGSAKLGTTIIILILCLMHVLLSASNHK